MPRSILRMSILNFYVVFGPHVHQNGKPGLYVFQPKFWALLYFSDFYIGHISRTKNICCFVHNRRVKKLFRMHCIERGMTNPPRWQWLGRPSSYFLSLNFCVFVDVRTTHWCAALYTCTSRLRLVRPKITYENDDKRKSELPHTAVRSMSLLAKKSMPTPIPMTPKISRSPRIAHPDR